MYKYLPKKTTRFFSVLFTLIVSFAVLALPTSVLAASAYITPATGLITKNNFKVSVYVESTTSEPEIASANIKITYPNILNVVSIEDGDFDSYLEKTNDPATSQITINAINNAGSYKSGKVKVASINFDTTATTGDVLLTIDSGSSIAGANGEQLLTETINGVYTLQIENTTPPAEETPPTTETPPTATDEVPETGVNDLLPYAILSAALMGLGLVVFANPLQRKQ